MRRILFAALAGAAVACEGGLNNRLIVETAPAPPPSRPAGVDASAPPRVAGVALGPVDSRGRVRDFERDGVPVPRGRRPPAQVVTGKLERRGPSLAMRARDGRTVPLRVDELTQVVDNGHPVRLDAFPEGTEVRASFVPGANGESLARKVEVIRPVVK